MNEKSIRLIYANGTRFEARTPEPVDILALLDREGIDLSASNFPDLTAVGNKGGCPLIGGPYSILERLRNEQPLIETVVVESSRVTVAYHDGFDCSSRLPKRVDFLAFLAREGIDISAPGFPELQVSDGD